MLLTPQPDRNTASTATNAKRRNGMAAVAERTMRFLRQDKGRPNVMARRDNTIGPLVVPAARRSAAACLAIVALVLLTPARAPAQERPAVAPPAVAAPVIAPPAVAAPVIAPHGMVASQEARATR